MDIKQKKILCFPLFFRSILYAYTYTHTLYFTFEQRKGHWLNQAYYIILSFGFCNRFYSLSLRFLIGPLHRHCKFFAFLLFIHPIVSDRSHSILAANAESSEREWKRKNDSQNLHCFRCFNRVSMWYEDKLDWFDAYYECTTCMCLCAWVRCKSRCYSIIIEWSALCGAMLVFYSRILWS